MKNPLFRTHEPSDYRTFGLESSHHWWPVTWPRYWRKDLVVDGGGGSWYYAWSRFMLGPCCFIWSPWLCVCATYNLSWCGTTSTYMFHIGSPKESSKVSFCTQPYSAVCWQMYLGQVTGHQCVMKARRSYCCNDTSMYRNTWAGDMRATQVSRYVSRYHKWRIVIRQRMYRDTRSDVQCNLNSR